MENKIITRPLNESDIVRKGKNLIHSKYVLSETATKVMTMVISQVDKNDDANSVYAIAVNDIVKLMGTGGGSRYQQIKRASEELQTKMIRIEDEERNLNGEDRYFLNMNWISSMTYYPKYGEVEITLAREMINMIIGLKKGNYLNYELKNILQLKSSYVIRLYEILKNEFNMKRKYKNIKTVEYTIEIEELREKFHIPKSYQYKDIRMHILDKAIEEFREKTDIEMDYQTIKRGRAVKWIEFTIWENRKLKEQKEFISYVRRNRVNQTLFKDSKIEIAVDKNGRLYDKRTTKEYTNSKAKEAWETLYELAKQNKLMYQN